LRKKINALKAERSNNETKIPEIPIKVLPSTFPKKALAKTENDIKCLELVVAVQKLAVDINKINVNIDKANIELIKAEIKA
jgi:hypothetical protein